MNNSRLFILSLTLFVFFFVVLTTVEAALKQPTIQNGTYVVKGGVIMSTVWSLATLQFDLDQDVELHVPMVVPCIGCKSTDGLKRNKKGELCLCDYSKQGKDCGKAPKGCPADTCSSENVQAFCDDNSLKSWKTIEVFSDKDDFSSISVVDLHAGEARHYRMHVTDPCRGYLVKGLFESGMVDLFVSQTVAEPTQANRLMATDYLRYPDKIELTLCPESAKFGLGTYFITALGHTPNTTFDLVTFSAASTKSRDGENSECDDGFCFEEGVTLPITAESGSIVSAMYEFATTKEDECITFTAYLRVESGDGDLYGDWEKQTNVESSSYTSSFQGSDIFYFQQCFDKPGKYPFYLYVSAWNPGDYFLTITTKKRAFLIPSLSLPTYQYGYSVTNVIVGKCPTFAHNPLLKCTDWGFSCQSLWSVTPGDEVDPFWPTPAIWNIRDSTLLSYMLENLRQHETPLLVPKTGRFSVVVPFTSSIFGKDKLYMDEAHLQECTFQALGHFFTKDGMALTGSSKVVPTVPKCNPAALRDSIEIGQKYLDSLGNTNDQIEIFTTVFQVNTLAFTSIYIGCRDLVLGYINETTVTTTINSTLCQYQLGTDEYNEDPCCNAELLVDQCCMPTEREATKVAVLGQDRKKVEKECRAPDCVESYLDDYVSVKQASLQCTAFSSTEYPKVADESVAFFGECKARYQVDALALGNAICKNDADCTFGGITHTCNVLTQRCINSYETEKAVVQCTVERLSTYQEFYFKEAFGLPGGAKDKEFLDALLEKLTFDNCENVKGDIVSIRKKETYSNLSPDCTLDCVQTNCLDEFCLILPTTCIVGCGMNWFITEPTEEECTATYKCPWSPFSCEGDDKSCLEACDAGPERYCSFCINDAYCAMIPSNSEKECEDMEACLLPDGTIELLSAEECKQLQMCSKPCHDTYSCTSAVQSSSTCIDTSSTSPADCAGIWNPVWNQCTYPVFGQSLCQASGFEYQSCNSLTLEECGACFSGLDCPINQEFLQCHIVPYGPCDSKEECLSEGGFCTDAAIYQNYGSSTSDDFGACIKPFYTEVSSTVPDCENRADVMTPEGCLSREYVTEAECNSQGFGWHKLASNVEECNSFTGCASYIKMYAYTTNPGASCLNCGYHTIPIFQWSSGEWLQSTPVSFNWKSGRSSEKMYEWKPVINFAALVKTLVDGFQIGTLNDLIAQTLCDFNSNTVPIRAASCACTMEDDLNVCFSDSDSAIETGKGIACIGLQSRLANTESVVFISNNSISQEKNDRCVDITTSRITVYTLEQPPQVPFSPLTQVREFDQFNIVRNDNEAIVGRVLSDGAEVQLNGHVQNMTICLRLKLDPKDAPKNCDTWDIGVPIPGKTDFLKPMNIKPVDSDQSNGNPELYCFIIHDPAPKETYYLILRVDDYENEDGSLYGDESIAWWIFAALYTVLATWSGIIVILNFFGFSLHFYFVGLFGFLALMCTIRAIYFYLLAATVFDEGTNLAVAYFLIEFPTLVYFTAFSCLAAFWLFLLYAHLKNHRHKIILIATLVFNTILYICFIVFIILFEALPSTTKTECAGRVAEENDNTNQQIISIVYQSFMAGMSLFLAINVALYGGKLFFDLKKRNFENKVAFVTVICALGLLAHCGFILYLSALLVYNFTIIVLMIVLSELLPITLIAANFSLMRFFSSKKVPSYNRKANFWRALQFWRSTESSSVGFSSDKTTSSKERTSKDTSSTTRHKSTGTGTGKDDGSEMI